MDPFRYCICWELGPFPMPIRVPIPVPGALYKMIPTSSFSSFLPSFLLVLFSFLTLSSFHSSLSLTTSPSFFILLAFNLIVRSFLLPTDLYLHSFITSS